MYLAYHKARVKRRIRAKNKTIRILARAGYTEQEHPLLARSIRTLASFALTELPVGDTTDSDSSPSSLLDSDSHGSITTSSSSGTDGGWSDVLGLNWRGSGSSSSSEDCSELSSESDEETLDLPPGYLADLDDSDDSESSDDEGSLMSDDSTSTDSASQITALQHTGSTATYNVNALRRNAALRWVCLSVEDMYEQRYEQPRNDFPRGPAYLPHVLTKLKNLRPDLFREELRVTPYTFDKLLNALLDDPVFTNNSRNGRLAAESPDYRLWVRLYGEYTRLDGMGGNPDFQGAQRVDGGWGIHMG
ncbi:hypothetical protein GGX14DRAFT_393503 [Mycena pura]|uniref:Uncharacterized protein n=1 Tax=Mycena pura TaxID=153505 RepID=A0AAD6VP76_9AGAR|nr:hypothetical protein GGX14DRAFT_408062 [Mycena pura]KAJ7212600.1 hypothetical protein GGX14DRAFT_393503 [Mycena pura]